MEDEIAAKHPKMCKTVPRMDRYPALNVNSATVEKACFRENVENNSIYHTYYLSAFFFFIDKSKIKTI